MRPHGAARPWALVLVATLLLARASAADVIDEEMIAKFSDQIADLFSRKSEAGSAFLSKLLGGGAAAEKPSLLMGQLHEALSSSAALFDFDLLRPQLRGLGGLDLPGLLANDTSALEAAWALERQVDQAFCTPPQLISPVIEPPSCAGPTVTLAVDGGRCVLNDDHTVTCTPATVRLIKTPGACTLHSKPSRVVKGKECKVVKRYGSATRGFLTHHTPANHTWSISEAALQAPAHRDGAASAALLQAASKARAGKEAAKARVAEAHQAHEDREQARREQRSAKKAALVEKVSGAQAGRSDRVAALQAKAAAVKERLSGLVSALPNPLEWLASKRSRPT